MSMGNKIQNILLFTIAILGGLSACTFSVTPLPTPVSSTPSPEPSPVPSTDPFSDLACKKPAQVAATVDFATLDTNPKPAFGFLHGISPSVPDSAITPLKPKIWRVPDLDSYSRITGFGSRVEVVLSDAWGYPSSSSPPPAPYADWTTWSNWITQAAQILTPRPSSIDVWNEPDYPDFWQGSLAQFYEMYRRAATGLRASLNDSYPIGGPSFSRYDFAALKGFLDFCVANGCEVNFLSWHEFSADFSTIATHLQEARAAFLSNPAYAAVKLREIHINEYLFSTYQYQPGAILSSLYYLEKGSANAGIRACWNASDGTSNCNNNSLSGLIEPGTHKPRAAWWTYKFHADSQATRVVSTTANERIPVFASQEGDSAVHPQIVLGSYDPSSSERRMVEVQISNLMLLPAFHNAAKFKILVDKIPDSGEQALTSPVAVSELSVSNPTTTPFKFCINDLGPSEAYRIRFEPSN